MNLVIFDWNGTLVDDAEKGLASANACFALYNISPISMECFRETFTLPWREFYYAHGVKEEQIDIDKHQEAFLKGYGKGAPLRLRAGVKETLETLKQRGIRIAIHTSHDHSIVEKELKKFGIFDYFNTIDAMDGMKVAGSKATKDMQQLIETFDIQNPKEVLFVGDMLIDIAAAKKNGFVSVIFSDGWQAKERLEAAHPDYFIKEFSDILDLVE